MRKMILLFVISLLLTGAISAQTPASTWYFGGARIDYKPDAVFKTTFGSAVPLGKSLWLLPNADIGNYDSLGRVSSLNADISYCVWAGRIGALHLLLSPGIDWLNAPLDENAPSYLNGAVGVFGVVYMSAILPQKGTIINLIRDKVGLYVAYRYKTDLKSASAYPSGSQIGFGIAIKK